MSTEKIENIKLRNFNDLNKEDVITSFYELDVSLDKNIEVSTYAESTATDYYPSVSKDSLLDKEKEFKDTSSGTYEELLDRLRYELQQDAQNNLEVPDDEIIGYDYKDKPEADTSISETTVDEYVKENPNDAKEKLLRKLHLSTTEYAVEEVMKDNVPTFVIIKKNILKEIKDTRDLLSSNFSETLDFHKKLDDIMLELYDEDRSMYNSLKVFFERLDSELKYELDSHLHMLEEDLIEDLRKQFETLKSKSESSDLSEEVQKVSQ